MPLKRDKIWGQVMPASALSILINCTLLVMEAVVCPFYVYLMVVKQPFQIRGKRIV